jgi:glycopeptide antibiotics resistance protein
VPLWGWWIGVVLLLSFPFEGAAARPHWDRINWVPFADTADGIADVVANVLLLVPFGWSLADPRRRARLGAVLAAAAAHSIGAESLKLFSTTRYPSATDVSCAVAGALVGAALRRRRDQPSAASRSTPKRSA